MTHSNSHGRGSRHACTRNANGNKTPLGHAHTFGLKPSEHRCLRSLVRCNWTPAPRNSETSKPPEARSSQPKDDLVSMAEEKPREKRTWLPGSCQIFWEEVAGLRGWGVLDPLSAIRVPRLLPGFQQGISQASKGYPMFERKPKGKLQHKMCGVPQQIHTHISCNRKKDSNWQVTYLPSRFGNLIILASNPCHPKPMLIQPRIS